jgi:phage N-6-adenine-methyltransferase
MNMLGRPRVHYPDRPATNAERQQAWQRQRAEELCQLRRKLARKVYHQSKRTTWGTPWDVFHEYDAEFPFTLDVCATEDNAKCPRFFSPEVDGLAQDWGDDICWMNPPYGREIGLWLEKAYRSSLIGAPVCCLSPARTGTRGWHAWVLGKGESWYRQGRIVFEGATDPAGFDALAVISRPPSTPSAPLGPRLWAAARGHVWRTPPSSGPGWSIRGGLDWIPPPCLTTTRS